MVAFVIDGQRLGGVATIVHDQQTTIEVDTWWKSSWEWIRSKRSKTNLISSRYIVVAKRWMDQYYRVGNQIDDHQGYFAVKYTFWGLITCHPVTVYWLILFCWLSEQESDIGCQDFTPPASAHHSATLRPTYFGDSHGPLSLGRSQKALHIWRTIHAARLIFSYQDLDF